MDDAEWVLWATKAGFTNLQIAGNILRWENYKSLFSLLQIGDGDILCYDSGQGLCRGQYSYGHATTPHLAPTWADLFSSYKVSAWAKVVKHKEGLNMDGEERMCDHLARSHGVLNGKDVQVLTAASPCNEKCADLLSKLVASGRPKSFTVRYFRAYTNQTEEAYAASLTTLQQAGIVCLPVHHGGVDPNIWRGVKDAKQVVKWMQTYNKKSTELEELSKQIMSYFQ